MESIRETIFLNKKGRILVGGLVAFIFLMALTVPVFADGEGGEILPDPGVGTAQDGTKANVVQWVLPYGFGYYIDDEGGDIDLDWNSVDFENTTAPVEGIIAVTGSGSDTNQECGNGAGFGGCQSQQQGNNLYFPEDLTPEMLNFPADTGASGYQNDCSKSGNDCQKEDGGVENGGTFWPTNDPDVVVIKAGREEYFFIQYNMACVPETMAYCVTWNGNGSITVVRIGEGPNRKEISNIQFWHTDHDLVPPELDPSGNCADVWVSPGVITVSAEQISPNTAVVVGQDPSEEGVTLEWHLRIDPTIVNYQKWEVVDQVVVACVEDDTCGVCNRNRNGNGHDDEWPNGGEQNRYGCGHNNCGCPDGWHPVVEDVYGCQDYYRAYSEGVDDLAPGASLSINSRAWIQGELSAAYPGADLINPDWAFSTPPDCIWDGDSCTMDFSLVIPVTDPGWYDIKLEGLTGGTQISPPRSFEVVAGEFGVYMIDTSLVAQ